MKKNKKSRSNIQRFYEELPDKSAPKAEFIGDVCKRAGIDKMRVYRYVWGQCTTTDEKVIKVLSEVSGIPEESLFEIEPELEEEKR